MAIEPTLDLALEAFKACLLERQCDDQKVTTVKIEDGVAILPDKEKWNRESIGEDYVWKNSRIVLLMESPHAEEFDKENKVIGPANGKTGSNIFLKLPELIQSIHNNNPFENEVYDLLLMNAVTFQCSLGFPTDHFRDFMFLGLWFDGARESFNRRIENLELSEKDIILSSCTRGSHKFFRKTLGGKTFNTANLKEKLQNQGISYNYSEGLRGLVDSSLEELNVKARIVKCIHPSKWDTLPMLRNGA